MAVNKETFGKIAKDLEPVGTVLKVGAAFFTCATAGVGFFKTIHDLVKKAKSAKDGEEINLYELGDTEEKLEPIVPEEVDDEDFGNLFGGSKEEVE